MMSSCHAQDPCSRLSARIRAGKKLSLEPTIFINCSTGLDHRTGKGGLSKHPGSADWDPLFLGY